jgi:hypothetical protein
MNRSVIHAGAVLFALLLFVPVDFAVAKRHPPAARRHQTLISSISPTSLTIQEDSGPKTFAITPYTEVVVNEQRASVAQLRRGMRVSVTLVDPTHLRQIKAWSTE